MFRVLIADDIGSHGVDRLEAAADVDWTIRIGLSPAELIAAIADYDGLIVRSATKVTSDVLLAGERLRVVGRAGMGVDNIDVSTAIRQGITVMNTPQANAMAAAEQTMALMLAATRHTAEAHQALSEGRWEHSQWVGTELYNKILGIIGFGRIGRLVASRAQSFGMDVVVFDPYVSEEVALDAGVELVNIEQLFVEVDYVTLHAPSTSDTENIIDSKAIESMKDGVVIVNVARGTLIDEAALAAAIRSGKVRAAGIDVYRSEPPEEDHPLIGLANVVHTPHLGASTVEAQRDVSVQIADQVIDALRGDDIRNAVNLPFVPGLDSAAATPYMVLAKKMGRLQFHMAGDPIRLVEVEVGGDIVEKLARPIASALLAGVLTDHLAEEINYVNAPVRAEECGIAISQVKGVAVVDYTNLISCRVHWDGGSRVMAGVLFGGSEPRLVQVSDYHLDVDPTDLLLIMLSKDVPGVVGMVGTTLGSFGVNIGEWRMGREGPGGEVLSFVNIDSVPEPEALEALRAEAAVHKLLLLNL